MGLKLEPALVPGIVFSFSRQSPWDEILGAFCSLQPMRCGLCVSVQRPELSASTLLVFRGFWLQGPTTAVFRGAAGMRLACGKYLQISHHHPGWLLPASGHFPPRPQLWPWHKQLLGPLEQLVCSRVLPGAEKNAKLFIPMKEKIAFATFTAKPLVALWLVFMAST